jgi:rod shape-determining protein MreD
MRRALLATAAVLAAVLVQATVLDNLPLPGGSPPDLVLLVVVTLALAGGPLEGAVIGFCAGLAADVTPPAAHLLGQSALVFCLVGYGCGRLRAPLERSSWLPLAGVALGVVAGESLYALAGMTFGDPDITWQTVRQVLPVSVFYDIALSPFVLYAVVRLGRFGEWAPDTGLAGLLTGRDLALAGSGPAAGAVRDTGSGRSPRLRLAAHAGEGRIGGSQPGAGHGPGGWVHRPRRLRLRLRGGVAGSASANSLGAFTRAGPMPAAPVKLGTSRRRDGAIGSAPGGSAAARAAFGDGGPARLRAGAFSGGHSALGQGGTGRRPRAVRLRLRSARRGDGLISGGMLAAALRGRPARRRAPGKGTFGGSGAHITPAAPGRSPGRGAFSGSGPRIAPPAPRRSPGRGAFSGSGPRIAPPAPRRSPGKGAFSGSGLRIAPPARRRSPGRGAFGGATGRLGGSPGLFARRGLGSVGPLRTGRGHGARPRFRGAGRGLFGKLRPRTGRRPSVWRTGS